MDLDWSTLKTTSGMDPPFPARRSAAVPRCVAPSSSPPVIVARPEAGQPMGPGLVRGASPSGSERSRSVRRAHGGQHGHSRSLPQRPHSDRVPAVRSSVPVDEGGPVEAASTAGDSLGPLASLIHLAVDTNDSERLAAAAANALARPVAVVDPAGDRLACLPDGPEGERALTVARAAARNGLIAAPAWSIVPIEHSGTLLGHLVIGADGQDDAIQSTVCDLLPALLADQLQRVA